MADVSILMLGGTKSGKTSFTLGMYADMRRGRQGVTLSAPSETDLFLTDSWKRLIRGGGEETRFPSPTAEVIRTEISLLYAFRRFMTFSWVDYPGASLSREKAALYEGFDLEEEVRKSQTIFICLPGDQLIKYIRSGDNEIDALNIPELNHLLASIGERVENVEDRPAIVVVVTKYDLFLNSMLTSGNSLKDGLRNLGISEGNGGPPELHSLCVLEATVISLLHPLFAEDCGFNVMICPVTLGMELARDPDNGTVDMRDTHHPFLFSYIEYARTALLQYERARRTNQARLSELSGRVLRIFLKDEIADAREGVERARERMEHMDKRRMLIQKLLPPNVILYRDGGRVSGPHCDG